jgi:small-conductance mechanosensitive channel
MNASLIDFKNFLNALIQPGALTELAVLAGCLAAAWGVVRLIRGHKLPEASIWLGLKIVDGVLFPVIALALAFGAQILLSGTSKAAVFKLAVPILLTLLLIRVSVRVLGATFPQARWVRVFERSISWLAWGVVALWLTGALPVLMEAMDGIQWKVGANRISLRSVLEGLLTTALVLVIALWIAAAIEKKLLHGTGDSLSLRKMVANATRAFLLLAGVLLALSTMGMDLTALSVLGGALGVGLGFGLQKVASSYVCGFVVLAERSLRIGDVVRIDGFEGCVTDIRTRYTVLRAFNGHESIIPNELLITHRLENCCLADRKLCLTTEVQVPYDTDVPALQTALTAAVSKVPRVVADPAPAVFLGAFAPDGLNLLVFFWIGDPENGYANVRSDVNLAIWATLNGLNIKVPFAQRVVHMPDYNRALSSDALHTSRP